MSIIGYCLKSAEEVEVISEVLKNEWKEWENIPMTENGIVGVMRDRLRNEDPNLAAKKGLRAAWNNHLKSYPNAHMEDWFEAFRSNLKREWLEPWKRVLDWELAHQTKGISEFKGKAVTRNAWKKNWSQACSERNEEKVLKCLNDSLKESSKDSKYETMLLRSHVFKELERQNDWGATMFKKILNSHDWTEKMENLLGSEIDKYWKDWMTGSFNNFLKENNRGWIELKDDAVLRATLKEWGIEDEFWKEYMLLMLSFNGLNAVMSSGSCSLLGEWITWAQQDQDRRSVRVDVGDMKGQITFELQEILMSGEGVIKKDFLKQLFGEEMLTILGIKTKEKANKLRMHDWTTNFNRIEMWYRSREMKEEMLEIKRVRQEWGVPEMTWNDGLIVWLDMDEWNSENIWAAWIDWWNEDPDRKEKNLKELKQFEQIYDSSIGSQRYEKLRQIIESFEESEFLKRVIEPNKKSENQREKKRL